MVLTTAANAVAHTSCAIADTVYYGADNQVMAWKLPQRNPISLAVLDGSVTALCEAKEHTLLIGTDQGSVVTLDLQSRVVTLLHKFERPVTCLASNYAVSSPNTGAATRVCYAVGCMDRQVIILNLENQIIHRQSLVGIALCAAFCENLLVLGGTFTKLLVLDLESHHETYVEGHEGWVRSLSFRKEGEHRYTLASGSQERYIRLWNFNLSSAESSALTPNEIMLSNAKNIGKWSITFEALLMGHDDWVVSVCWDPQGARTLLSASADSSLILWEAESSDLWTPDHRLGDVSNWGASTATGTTGGFWTALWVHLGAKTFVISVTRSGSFRVYEHTNSSEWQPQSGPTGHFKTVTDVAWFHNEFLLTTSLDQTTRLWHYTPSQLVEIGRPQIHGYDMVAVAPIDEKTFVSAGDEKVLRVFALPQPVAQQMQECTPNKLNLINNLGDLPLLAGVPALGLSNKPETVENGQLDLPEYPREDVLQRLTLWPEVDKLYGHGYEISYLAVSSPCKVLVSASKANTEKHARLKFFSLETFHEITKFSPTSQSHSLTVNKLAVSPDGQRVLSVGRDRKFMVTEIASQVVEVDFPKAHSRIVWDGAWCSNLEFITGSRDKQVKKWRLNNTTANLLTTAKFDQPITAVAASADCIAVGEESGKLSIWDADLATMLQETWLPHKINRIAFNRERSAVAAVSGNTLQVITVTKAAR